MRLRAMLAIGAAMGLFATPVLAQSGGNTSGTTSGSSAGSTATPSTAADKTQNSSGQVGSGSSSGSPGTAGAPGNKNGPPAKKPQ